MTPLDPARAAIARRAAEGARTTRLGPAKRKKGWAGTSPRAKQALEALLRLRTEVVLGATRTELLDKIDDELYGLRKWAAVPEPVDTGKKPTKKAAP